MNKRSASKRKSQPKLKPVYAAVLLAIAIESAQANPMDATVVSGQASFATTGNTLTVVNTPGTIINWQSFSIGSSEITNFVQQSASSAVLNRVIGNDPSNILGTLQSNGRVFLINPHGIAFGAGSVVDVAGLVASTLNISDADFQAGRYNFTAVPGAQNVSNAGNITAQDNGQIYLIAPNVENSGVITAPNGEIYLAAGSSVELVNSNDPNLRVSITAPAGDATNVGQLIASSGNLGLFGTVVRNSGTVSADSATMQGGRIVFRASERVEAGGTISASGAGGGEIKVLADMQSGTVNVSGTLDASAPVSGDGGYIDTSAAHVQIADSASITTAAANGNSGNWLIDPTDFYVSAADPLNGSSWMSNTTLSSSLLAGNVTIQTLATGVSNGDIFVNGVVSWSANKLTLNAHNNINFNANLNGSGTASLALAYGQGAVALNNTSGYKFATGVRINLPAGLNFSTQQGSDGAVIDYTVITSLGAMGSVTGTDLQGINGNLAGNYVLGANINAAATSTWNLGAGFTPIGNFTTNFTGRFDGLGHAVSNPTISGVDSVGLFGAIGVGGSLANLGLVGGSVMGSWDVGGLVGVNFGKITNSYVRNISVSGTSTFGIGGLAGENFGTISNSFVDNGIVTGVGTLGATVGGLVGQNWGLIDGSYVSGGSVTGAWNVGGLVGWNAGALTTSGAPHGGTISNSYVTNGTVVNGSSTVGGLVGLNQYIISNSHVDGVTVTGSGSNVGGLAGLSQGGNGGPGGVGFIGNPSLAGAAGTNAVISNSYVSGGSVTGTGNNVGGLVGSNIAGNGGTGGGAAFTSFAAVGAGGAGGAAMISNSYVTGGTVTGSGGNVGGLVGNNVTGIAGANGVGTLSAPGGAAGVAGIVNSNVSGSNVTALVGLGATYLGGLAGYNSGAISNSYVGGGSVNAMVTDGSGGVGGVAGYNSGSISNSYVTSGLVNGNGIWDIGGLVGFNAVSGTIGSSYVASSVTSLWGYGGLVGWNDGAVTNGFWNTDLAGVTAINTLGLGTATNVIGLTSLQMLSSLNFAGFDFTAGTGTWYMIEGDTRPFLQSEWSTNITNAHQLQLMSMNLGAIYTLGADIDMAETATGTGMWGSAGFVPMGANPNWPIYGIAFTGQLDGQNHIISNLTINRPATGYVGLFGGLGWGSVVSNVGLVGGSVSGLSRVGALAAYNYGSIINSYVSGMNISGCVSCSNIGGLVGMNDGLISNSFVSGGSISGGWYVGGLVGQNSSGTINSSHVIGGVGSSISGAGAVGGLVGWNGGAINGSYVSAGNVSGSSSVGGLAGKNSSFGSINNSYVDSGTVVNGGAFVGGLVGWDSGEGVITGNTVTGTTVNGINNVGGLVGWMGSTFWVPGYIDNNHVINSFVSGGTVTGGTNIGGLVGWNGGSISNSSVSGGSVTGNWNVGGLVGYNGPYVSNGSSSFSSSPNFQGGFISNSYVATGTVVGSLGNVGGLVGRNDGKVSNAYYNVNGVSINGAYRVTLNGLYNNVLNINGVGQFNDWVDGGQLTPLNIADYAMLSGSAGSYTINSVQGMKALLGFADNAAYTFSLASNIDLATLPGYYIPYLAADFNGVNFTVSNLNLSLSNDYQGLFGHIASGSTVSNVNLLNATVTGGSNVGALAGWNEGIISNSNVTNGTINSSVAGLVYAGGLVGWNAGSISNSFVAGTTVTAASGDAVGGLVGWNTATIDTSYATASQVTGRNGVGGLVGINSGGAGGAIGSSSAGVAGSAATIGNSYVSGGAVIGDINVGGLVGQNLGGNGGMGGSAYWTSQIGLAGGAGGLASISNSYVSGGTVSGNSNVGGVIGQNLSGNGGKGGDAYYGTGGVGGAGGAATLSNSYVSGVTISGAVSNVGGLVGDNAIGVAGLSGTAFFTGIAGAGGAAGVAGIGNSFWNADTSGSLLATGINTGTLTNVVGYTTAQMMSMSSFTGWNIANTGGAGMTWRIYEGSTMPLLTAFLKPLIVTLGDDAKTYDGLAYVGGNGGVTYSDINAPLSGTLAGTLYGGTANGAVNAGGYVISASGLYSSQLGYDITYVDGQLSVAPALLTIVADDLSKLLTTTDPLLTYTVYGLILTDSAATTVDGGLIREPGEAAGIYQIGMDPSNPFVVLNSNYVLDSPTYFTPGTFTILAPTVINEIVNISVQGTTFSDEDEKKDSPETLALLETPTTSSDPEVQSLPVCQ